MAAHVKTALEQISEQLNNEQNYSFDFDSLDAALNLSCWTEDLSLEDFTELDFIIAVSYRDYFQAVDDLKQFITVHYLKYKQEWLDLGQPATREEWRQLKWGAK